MLKKVFVVAIAAMFTLGTVSCREESTFLYRKPLQK